MTENQYLTSMIPERTSIRSNSGHERRNSRYSSLGAEAHHPLDAGAVVPGAVEQDDLAGRRQVRDVALEVPLRLLALGRRAGSATTRHDARVRALGDALDDAALAGRVAALEDHDDLQALRLDVLLHDHELALELAQLPVELGAPHSSACARMTSSGALTLSTASRFSHSTWVTPSASTTSIARRVGLEVLQALQRLLRVAGAQRLGDVHRSSATAPAPLPALSSARSSSSGTSGMSQASTSSLLGAGRAQRVDDAGERVLRLVGLDPDLGLPRQLRQLRVLLGDDHDLLAARRAARRSGTGRSGRPASSTVHLSPPMRRPAPPASTTPSGGAQRGS